VHSRARLLSNIRKLFKSATEKRDLKKHLLLSLATWRLKAREQNSAKRLDYYVYIESRERLFGSNQ